MTYSSSEDMTELSQGEADGLMKTPKRFIDNSPLIVNRAGREQRELISAIRSDDKFYLNITQTAIEYGIYSTVNRYFQTPLIRLCIDKDFIHENPDGTKIKGSHIHIYREGERDGIAFPISEHGFISEEIVHCIEHFLEICNIEQIEIRKQGRLNDYA